MSTLYWIEWWIQIKRKKKATVIWKRKDRQEMIICIKISEKEKEKAAEKSNSGKDVAE